MPTDDRSLVEHLATKVLGLQVFGASFRTPKTVDGFYRIVTLDLDSWADAGMVLDMFRKIMVYSPFHIRVWSDVYTAGFSFSESKSDSGPRAICLAVARATNWEGEKK
jgi:hypothetical protein